MPITTFFFCLFLLGLAQSIIRYMQLNLTYLYSPFTPIDWSIDILVVFALLMHISENEYFFSSTIFYYNALVKKKKNRTQIFFRSFIATSPSVHSIWLKSSLILGTSSITSSITFDSIIAEENSINWKKGIKRIIVFLKHIQLKMHFISESIKCFVAMLLIDLKVLETRRSEVKEETSTGIKSRRVRRDWII